MPVLAATNGASEHTPTGSVTRIFVLEQDGLVINLAACRGQDASRVMAELRTALRTCRKFPVVGGASMSFVKAPLSGLGWFRVAGVMRRARRSS
ncbi:hypothetical protein, partial [Streptomyces sp. NPDC005125]